MAAFSTYLENELLDHVLGGAAYTTPSPLYLALFPADGGLESGTITNELSGGGYARVAFTPGTHMGPASAGSIASTAELAFPEATADWNGGSDITHMAIMDAAAAGNVLIHGALTTPKTISTGDVAKYSAGNLTVSLD